MFNRIFVAATTPPPSETIQKRASTNVAHPLPQGIPTLQKSRLGGFGVAFGGAWWIFFRTPMRWLMSLNGSEIYVYKMVQDGKFFFPETELMCFFVLHIVWHKCLKDPRWFTSCLASTVPSSSMIPCEKSRKFTRWVVTFQTKNLCPSKTLTNCGAGTNHTIGRATAGK